MESRYGQRVWSSQPVYTIEEAPVVEYRYRKRRDLARSESSVSVDRRNYTVEDPPDGGFWAWMVVLACGLLHLCNEIVYFIFYDTIVIANFRNGRLATPKDTYTEFMVFEDIRLAGEFIAALASVFVGFRVVAVFGSLCVGAGFLGAAFVKPSEEIELMGFLVGFLGGIGCSFWRFAAYVAIMEYFRKHRMTALILSGFGRVIGIFVGYAVIARPLQMLRDPSTSSEDIENMTEWKTYYICQVAPAGVAFIASLLINPLPLVTSRKSSDCAWCLRIRTTRLCRGGMLFVTVMMYFLYYFGESLPNTTILYWMHGEGFSTDHIIGTLFGIACGVLGGYLLLAFWPLVKKLYGSLLWMGVFCLVLGLITLIFPVYKNPYVSYVAAYGVMLGILQVMFETLLRYVIPIGFGRSYIRWIEGLLGLVAGCATIANNFIAKELVDISPDYLENVYYFAGAAFLAAGLFPVVVVQLAMCMKFEDINYEKHDTSEVVERSIPVRMSGRSRGIVYEDPYPSYYNYK
ncbi:hypothetical protein ACF0H5_012957 [Mactra antiquata]